MSDSQVEVAKALERAIEAAHPDEEYMVVAIYVTKSDGHMRMICNAGPENAKGMLAAGFATIEQSSDSTNFKTSSDH